MSKILSEKLGIDNIVLSTAIKELGLNILTTQEKTDYEKRLTDQTIHDFEKSAYLDFAKELDLDKSDKASIKAKIAELKKMPIAKNDKEIELRENAISELRAALQNKEVEIETIKNGYEIEKTQNEFSNRIKNIDLQFSSEELALGDENLQKLKAERLSIIQSILFQNYEILTDKKGTKIIDKSTGKEAKDSKLMPLSMQDIINLTIESNYTLKSFVQPKNKIVGKGLQSTSPSTTFKTRDEAAIFATSKGINLYSNEYRDLLKTNNLI